MADKIIRVLLVDDHQVVRRGLRTFLEVQDDIEVVGEASDGAEGVARTEELRPDVVLMDIKMPGTDGIEALRKLRELENPAKVLIVTSFTEQRTVVPALRAGASGYVYKDVDPDALAGAIRSVYAGHVLLQPEVAGALLAQDDAGSGTGRGAPLPNGSGKCWVSSLTAAPTARSREPGPLREDRQDARLEYSDEAGSLGPHPGGPLGRPARGGGLTGTESDRLTPD